MVSYRKACLMGMYLSRFTMAKWDSHAIPNTLKTIVANSVLIQYVLEVFPCSSAITSEIYRGLPITPFARSVVDKQASAMLDLVFSWFLVFTAIMTSAFIAVVSGQVTMQMTVMKTSVPWSSILCRIAGSHAGTVPVESDAAVEFIPSLWLNLMKISFLFGYCVHDHLLNWRSKTLFYLFYSSFHIITNTVYMEGKYTYTVQPDLSSEWGDFHTISKNMVLMASEGKFTSWLIRTD